MTEQERIAELEAELEAAQKTIEVLVLRVENTAVLSRGASGTATGTPSPAPSLSAASLQHLRRALAPRSE